MARMGAAAPGAAGSPNLLRGSSPPRKMSAGTGISPPRSPPRGYAPMSRSELVSDEVLPDPCDSSRDGNYADDADVSDREWDLAFARTTIGVTMREEGTCRIEESVYGAAILMPQLARTVRWNKTMTMLAIQSWMFLVLNVLLQAYLLKMLAKEEIIMDGFAGQMFLCDFGAGIEACPGPGCRGPGGTDVTGPRLYSWEAIVDRTFVRDSFAALFPDKIDEINAKIDPGEYGVESYWCRLACCFIFMISCMDDLNIIYKIAQLLYKIPTEAGRWIRPRPNPGYKLHGSIEEVEVKIAGMPLKWKVINGLCIVLPKLVLWKLTAETGMGMLMDTSGIDDIITNSVALTFILGIDELMGTALMTEEALNFVKSTEDFPLFDESTSCVGNMSLLSDDELLEQYQKIQCDIRGVKLQDMTQLIPTKFVVSVLGTVFFVWEYYSRHCVQSPDDENRYISKTMYLPKSMQFTWLNALIPNFFPVERGDMYWEMPKVQ